MNNVQQTANPYDPTQTNYDNATPSAHAVIAHAIEQGALNLRVAYPARVTHVISAQRVSLQPLFSSQYVGGVTQPLPVVPEAHVVLLGGRSWGVTHAPIAIGDLGLALVADRNIATWAASDGTTPLDPQDSRCHNLTDSFFLPGAVPTALEATEKTPDVVVTNQATQLRIGPAGFTLSNGKVELVGLVQALANQTASLANAVASITSGGISVDAPSKLSLAQQASAAASLAAQAKSLIAKT